MSATGNPPVIDDLIAAVDALEQLVAGWMPAPGYTYATGTARDADLSPPDGAYALVSANGSLWRKVGAPGTGSWQSVVSFLAQLRTDILGAVTPFEWRDTRFFFGRDDAAAAVDALPADARIVWSLEGGQLVVRQRTVLGDTLAGTADPWGVAARVPLSAADPVPLIDGFVIVTDSAGRAVLVSRTTGLDFQPSTELLARIASGSGVAAIEAGLDALERRDTRFFFSRQDAEAAVDALPAEARFVFALEGSALAVRQRTVTADPLAGTADPWGVSARLPLDAADPTQSLAGLVLIADAAGQAVLVARTGGLDFVPSPELLGRIAQAVSASAIVPTDSLGGYVVLVDAAGQALLAAAPDGLDLVPSRRLVGRIGHGSGYRAEVPFDAAHSWEETTFDGQRAVLCSTAEWRGSEARYATVRGLTFAFAPHVPHGPSASVAREIQLLPSSGQSLAVGTDFTATGENTPPVDHIAPWHVFDVVDGQEVRGWQSADGRNAVASGLRVAPLPTVRQTPIATAAAALAEARRQRNARQVPMIVRNHGYAGQSYRNIDHLSANDTDAGNVWPTFKRWLAIASAEAEAYGMVPRCRHAVLIHGTADKDTPAAEYTAFLAGYLAAVEAEARLATGQSDPVRLVLTQDGGDTQTTGGSDLWDVCQAQLEFAAANPDKALLAGPLYPYRLWDGQVHPGVAATVLFSEVIGHAIAADEAGEPWTIGPPTLTRSGTTITADFGGRLRGDELLAIAPDPYGGVGCPNLGFVYGGATIAAVEVAGALVRITLATVPSGPAELSYAFQVQDVSVSSPLYSAHRGRLRTTWFRPSAHLPGQQVFRWIPSFKGQV